MILHASTKFEQELISLDSAYIAASRRSDRSLEARIESARRASEIHKKRTGRALRVTEQDVVNEEMYEEEDDDLPSQYQRLSAHLSTTNMLFNRKLHDYIATQTAVRSAAMNPQFQYGYFPPSNGVQFTGTMNPFMGHQMPPPPPFNPSPQTLNQPQQGFTPSAFQQSHQSYRQSPYPLSNRPQPHQRSASIPMPQQMPGYQQSVQYASSVVSTPQGNEQQRRMSLPPEMDATTPQAADGQARPQLSRSTTAHSVQQQPNSPHDLSPHTMSPPRLNPSASTTPTSLVENTTSYPFMSMGHDTPSQVLSTNPLTMSLPPESQQFVGSALDPNDPLMAGSDSLPQPFNRGGYHYNPNVSPKSSRAWNVPNTGDTVSNSMTTSGMNATKDESVMDNSTSSDHPSATSEDEETMAFTGAPTFNYDAWSHMYESNEFTTTSDFQVSSEDFDPSNFLNI